MCGIVGLFLKSAELRENLGDLISDMLIGMTSRGPDSAGIALYHNPAAAGFSKLTLFDPDNGTDWSELASALSNALSLSATASQRGNHGVLTVEGGTAVPRAWLKQNHPHIHIMGHGSVMEVYKDKGLPEQVVDQYDLRSVNGTHAIGHTRMATESAVTTEGAHPFTAADDMCLVHNGSLSNYFRLRQWLRRQGQEVETENDSEVAAKYFAFRLSQGMPLDEALRAGFRDLDGFYTFAMGTRDGFAVVRDGIGCKPAQLAETDDWVAMASEYRSLTGLPGIEKARLWEPEPSQIYSWDLLTETMQGAA
ncbi:MAG: amidophosphoribosyltransferase [Pseudomonadota bacterium]